MKKLFSLIAIGCASYFCQAQELRTPYPSPPQTIKQDFGLSTIELSYSRPGVKGRTIFGDLVPYGKVWRTGANNATTIQFGEDIVFGDAKVPAGKYGLLTIPDRNQWTVILTKQLDVTSPAAYRQDQDVARVVVTPDEMPFSVESFMIIFENLTASSTDMLVLWDRTAVKVPIKSDVDSKIMASIDELMNKDNRPYYEAALYYMNNGKDLNKAMGWFDKAVQQSPNAFWVWHQRANCLAKLGRKQDAIASANKSIELAKAAKNDDYVSLNNKLIASLK